jgi:hypothetical protein
MATDNVITVLNYHNPYKNSVGIYLFLETETKISVIKIITSHLKTVKKPHPETSHISLSQVTMATITGL